jgi:acyl dehydratase
VALDIGNLGARHGPRTTRVDADRARAYAAATNDDNPAYREGRLAPPVFGVVPTWDIMLAALLDVVPPDALPMLLHLRHDMWFHRPLEVGATLVTAAEVSAVRVRRPGSKVTVRVDSRGADGTPILEQYATMFIRGLGEGDGGGSEPPDHALPAGARKAQVAERTTVVDADQTFRYRDASGDDNPIHVDDAFARSVGLPGIVVHGLCTMAFCSQAAVGEMAGGDPALLRRLAVRFSRPLLPGSHLTTRLYDLDGGRGAYGFEASSDAGTVVKDGRAEIGPPLPAVSDTSPQGLG